MALNEHGQFYWTFEELDLKGAFSELKDQANYLLEVNAALDIQISKLDFHDAQSKELSYEFDSNYFQIEELCKIMQNIEILIRKGGVE